jgi:cellulose synthase/poly-beta-1,6-N-acetylglucosamine synthase-like glycosyltransferase/peptidoglycan/xylan/chitin deacetylase (PgdA/CDA1 family)
VKRARERAVRAARLRRSIRRPPGHWALLGFLLAAMIVLLGVQGLATRTTGASGTPEGQRPNSPLAGAGPVLYQGRDGLTSAGRDPGRRIALTFDDGPSPTWTPRVVAALERLHVPATFFVTGANVSHYPGVLRDLTDRGFEIGNHTFTHVDVSVVPGWERSLQLDLTENAIAGATGDRPRLMRPPYSATPAAVTPKQFAAFRDLAEHGSVVVLSDLDGRDWMRPGADEIARNITPKDGKGGIVLLHDGGGNRAETIAALERVVPALKRQGYEFVTASRIAGIAPTAAAPEATGWQRMRGDFLIATLWLSRFVTGVLTFLLIPIAVLALLRMALLFAFARRHARAYARRRGQSGFAPPVSVVVPAFNEAVGIERAVRSLALSDYGDFEVIVVDDGSTDGTADLVEDLDLSRVTVLRQPNGGKSSALNRALLVARHDVVVTVDGDTVFEPDTLGALVIPFEDPDVGAVSGNTKVGNRRGMLGRWQHIEYVLGFNLDRRLYDELRCMPTVPGAIGGFRREALADAGGFSTATLAEDTDITLAVGRAGWRVVYVEDARAWTEAPPSLSALWRQRYRWSFGTMQAVWKHKAALWRPHEWRIGRLGLPYLVLFQIILPLLAPLIDLFAIYGLVFLDPMPVIGYWLAFNALNLVLAVYAFRLDRESLRPLWALPLQQFVYRQLMYLVVIESVVSALNGTRLKWQNIERSGDVEVGTQRDSASDRTTAS